MTEYDSKYFWHRLKVVDRLRQIELQKLDNEVEQNREKELQELLAEYNRQPKIKGLFKGKLIYD